MHKPWEVAEAVMGVSRRVLLRGKPGTGKTYHAVHSGLREDQKVYSITMTEETSAAELRGHYVPKGGEFIWTDGVAVLAWKEGARLVINEIDRSSDDVLSLMYAILDDPDFARLTLPTGETVRPKEGFQVVATMNGVPDDLPDALQDRLPVDIEITDLNPEALSRLPEDLREAAANTALAPSEQRAVSIRMWLEFASLREKLKEVSEDDMAALEMAASAVFGDQAQDALNALTMGAEASAPIDMDGIDWSQPGLVKMKNRIIEWAEFLENCGWAEYEMDRFVQTAWPAIVADTPAPDMPLSETAATRDAVDIILTRTNGLPVTLRNLYKSITGNEVGG